MIKVIAQFFIKEENLVQALELGIKLVKETRMESGCLNYNLLQDESNPNHLIFIEEWVSGEALDIHFKTSHFTEIIPKLEALKEKETVIEKFLQIV